jgi:hypothetical protein
MAYQQQPYYQSPPQKRSSAIWWIIGGCGVILVLTVLCVCGFFTLGGAAILSMPTSVPLISRATPGAAPGQPTEAAPESYKVGEAIRLRDTVLTVTGVEFSQGTDFDTPDAGKVYILVHVHLENAGSQKEVSVNPLDFRVLDSNGVMVDNAFTSIPENPLDSVELAPGGKIDGTIPFEVPEGDQGLQLVYQPNWLIDRERVYIDLQ